MDANSQKIRVDNMHSKDRGVDPLVPLGGVDLAFQLEVILSLPVVLINLGTPRVVQVADFWSVDHDELADRLCIGCPIYLSPTPTQSLWTIVKLRASRDEVATVTVDPTEGHQLSSSGRILVEETILVAFAVGHDNTTKKLHWELLCSCLDNTNKPEANRLESEGCLHRGKVAVADNHPIRVSPWLDELIQDITAMKESVSKRQEQSVGCK